MQEGKLFQTNFEGVRLMPNNPVIRYHGMIRISSSGNVTRVLASVLSSEFEVSTVENCAEGLILGYVESEISRIY
jgi:hypothetical protein